MLDTKLDARVHQMLKTRWIKLKIVVKFEIKSEIKFCYFPYFLFFHRAIVILLIVGIFPGVLNSGNYMQFYGVD